MPSGAITGADRPSAGAPLIRPAIHVNCARFFHNIDGAEQDHFYFHGFSLKYAEGRRGRWGGKSLCYPALTGTCCQCCMNKKKEDANVSNDRGGLAEIKKKSLTSPPTARASPPSSRRQSEIVPAAL
ncbi:hypothetical protein EVAR_10597_1 [Eumeta japonica]|uniref:Uncharacterized protein n=1 Tax=Eumeta variegata TaxID=151549 RepID=A0A4C1U1U5_EUMVA|nr:hypothetical protein EVAR_10597_1 [Eumeta japonica]